MEFSDSTNARKSGGRFIWGSLGCDELEENIESLFGSEGMIVVAVGLGGLGMGAEFLSDGNHGSIVAFRKRVVV